jgi:hypothetical protein
MKHNALFTIAAAGLAAMLAAPAAADCRPLKTDVVGLGEKSPRGYAGRNLQKAIEAEKDSITVSGGKAGRVTKPTITCKPFPNLIGANEWRCVGEAKVCTKTK